MCPLDSFFENIINDIFLSLAMYIHFDDSALSDEEKLPHKICSEDHAQDWTNWHNVTRICTYVIL